MAMRLAARLVGGSSETEDILQEAGLQAWLQIDALRDGASFGAWLSGISLNVARQTLRRGRFAIRQAAEVDQQDCLTLAARQVRDCRAHSRGKLVRLGDLVRTRTIVE